MKRARSIGLGCLGLVLAVAPASIGATEISASISASSDLTARSTTFRSQFGLDADPGFVASVQNDPSASLELGIALLPAEVADLQRRDEVDKIAFGLQADLGQDERFGGLWVDQPAGGVVVVNEVGASKDFEQKLSASLPSDAVVRFVPAKYSLAYLTSLRNAAEAIQDDLSKSVGLSMIGADPVSNLVTLGLNPYTNAGVLVLQKSFGEAIHVIPAVPDPVATCVNRGDCPDHAYKGGIGIYNTLGGTSYCTAGFGAGKVTGGTANHWYILTAGHCIEL